MKEQLVPRDQRSVHKIKVIEVSQQGGGPVDFDCPGCGEPISAAPGFVDGRDLTTTCPDCGWRGTVRLRTDPSDTERVDDETIAEITDFVVDGPSVEFACPGCGGTIRTSKTRIGDDDPVPVRCTGACNGTIRKVNIVEN